VWARFICDADLSAASDGDMSRHDIAAKQLYASCVRLGRRDASDERIKVGQYVRQRRVRQVNSLCATGITAAEFGCSRRADQPHVSRFRNA
jgi:hypothetical protein